MVLRYEIGVPGRAEADVVAAVAMPAADMQAVLDEVADARDEASIGAYVARPRPYHWESSLTTLAGLYAFFPEFYSGAVFLRTSPLKASKKFHLYLLSHTIVIRGQRYSGDVSKEEAPARRSRNRACISR